MSVSHRNVPERRAVGSGCDVLNVSPAQPWGPALRRAGTPAPPPASTAGGWHHLETRWRNPQLCKSAQPFSSYGGGASKGQPHIAQVCSREPVTPVVSQAIGAGFGRGSRWGASARSRYPDSVSSREDVDTSVGLLARRADSMVCREPLLAAGDARHCHCREEQLWWSYTTPVQFERLVRAHLEDVVVRRAGQTSAAPAARERPRAPVRFNLPLVPRLFVGRPASSTPWRRRTRGGAADELCPVAETAMENGRRSGGGGHLGVQLGGGDVGVPEHRL
jgi:hypothetical protein